MPLSALNSQQPGVPLLSQACAHDSGEGDEKSLIITISSVISMANIALRELAEKGSH